jgi:hypothetical protein
MKTIMEIPDRPSFVSSFVFVNPKKRLNKRAQKYNGNGKYHSGNDSKMVQRLYHRIAIPTEFTRKVFVKILNYVKGL